MNRTLGTIKECTGANGRELSPLALNENVTKWKILK
jgi:hypothetical protein